MPREESQIPNIFYSIIDKISNDLWLKFVRLLGLAEADIKNVASRDRGLLEKKYQTLNRWKMYIGILNDTEIGEILKKTLNELDCGHEFNCMQYPDRMKQNIVKARRIYRFIESYSRDTWNVPARRLLQLNEADIMRIRDNYEDALEMRYQMVLRWIRTFKIDDDSLLEKLNEFQAHPFGEQHSSPQNF